MGSRAIRDSYLALGWLRPEDPALVIPYGIERPERPDPRPAGAPDLPLRFGLLGSVLPHKGIHLAVAAFRGIDPARAEADGLGGPRDLARLYGGARGPRFAGRALRRPFRRGAAAGDPGGDRRAPRPLAGARVVRPGGARGPGRGGAGARQPARRARRAVRPRGRPSLRRPVRPRGARRSCGVDRAADRRPGIVGEWRAAAPAVKSMDEHAEEIEEVYERLLASRARTL